jgi:hypothetical protein
MVDNEIIKEIDNLHKSANEALRLKQFDRYMDFFSDSLQYKQLNRKTIGKKQLVKDVSNYFDRIQKFSSQYERKNCTIGNQKVIETLIQQTSASLRVFVFFSKNWIIEREGIYEWEKINNTWKIVKVEILKETVL